MYNISGYLRDGEERRRPKQEIYSKSQPELHNQWYTYFNILMLSINRFPKKMQRSRPPETSGLSLQALDL